MRLLLVDNFDSFVFNIAQAFGALGAEPIVVRNDATLAEINAARPDAVCISPGPGAPNEAGVSLDAIKHFAGKVPILGVCLGHQCIAQAFGGRVSRSPVGPVHGKTSQVVHDGKGVFRDVPSPFTATRYHSLAVEVEDWPRELQETSRSEDGVVMGLRHKTLAIEGVQFHPESILTKGGPLLMKNFLEAAQAAASPAPR